MVKKLNIKEEYKIDKSDIDYYIKSINNHFDENISYIKKYTKQLESWKSDILDKLEDLKNGDYSDTYIKYKVEHEIDNIVSGIRIASEKLDSAELSAERFINVVN
jgi:hypothetical protein